MSLTPRSPATSPLLPILGQQRLTPPNPPQPAADVVAQLTAQLRRRTKAEVRFDDGSRAIYASDLSHYRQLPIGVVIPRTVEDVVETVAVCRALGVPILGRGAGTSLAGQTCNVAVVLDFSKYLNRLLEMNARKRYAWVEPGLINDHLRDAAERHALTFAPDPATHRYCTLGGMIGNNSCGPHSVLGGKTSENIDELEILLYDGTRMTVGATTPRELDRVIRAGGRKGEIYRGLRDLRDRYAEDIRTGFPQIPRRVSGFNLDYLLPENGFHVARALVGTESTCALVLRAKTRLIHSPSCRVMLLVAFRTIFEAADLSPELARFEPIAIEGFERHVIDNARLAGKHMPGLGLYPPGEAWLLVEFGAETPAGAMAAAQKAEAWIRRRDRTHTGLELLETTERQRAAMEVRELALGTSQVPGRQQPTWGGWEDAAVEPRHLGAYLREFYALAERFGYFVVLFGHFGQGCLHCQLNFDLRTEEGLAHYRAFVTEAAHLVVRHGGSLSGEHGDGQSRAELLPIMFSPRLMEAFREFKRIWDPEGKMNPGKVVDPYPLDSHIRMGPDYHPKPVLTYFGFPDDNGSLSDATERCFGVGKCRSLEGGTMCPSFHVTREEQHSTRGRARMLFEMLRGDVLDSGWKSPEIKEALDLCLACKGCKGDCPVSVDLATYKAEFLAHFYETESRPAAAYSMGHIDTWANLAHSVPMGSELANLVTQTPGLAALAKAVAGVTQHRDMPRFPRQSFQQWFRGRTPGARAGSRGKVILWADTFNNHFTPHTAEAALEVLEDAGFRVEVPREHLCCGRPLYDFGFLDQAKTYLLTILNTLKKEIAAGTPIVVLEPSCASVFKDELINLMPREPQARKLQSQVILFADFLEKVGYKPAALPAGTKAIVHGHCHQKALWSMAPEKRLLEATGAEAQVLDSGCCGLAGSFGYEAEHHELSMAIGNQVLLPKVRAADRKTMVVSDGFSCRQQIAHGSDRTAMHTAEVLQMALRGGPKAKRKQPVETGFTQPGAGLPVVPLLAGAGLLVAAAYVFRRVRANDRGVTE